MKKLEIIIKDENLDDLKEILTECNANDIMISKIKHYDNQKGYKKICRGTEYYVDLLRRVKAEIIVTPEVSELIIDKVLKEISTGNYKECKIFSSDIEDVVKIRVAEHGFYAL